MPNFIWTFFTGKNPPIFLTSALRDGAT